MIPEGVAVRLFSHVAASRFPSRFPLTFCPHVFALTFRATFSQAQLERRIEKLPDPQVILAPKTMDFTLKYENVCTKTDGFYT